MASHVLGANAPLTIQFRKGGSFHQLVCLSIHVCAVRLPVLSAGAKPDCAVHELDNTGLRCGSALGHGFLLHERKEVVQRSGGVRAEARIIRRIVCKVVPAVKRSFCEDGHISLSSDRWWVLVLDIDIPI